MQWARGKLAGWVTGGIVAFVGFVFVVSGVFNPKSTSGLHEGAVAGTVNDDSISLSEFNRSVNQRIEMFKGMMQGKFSDDQIKQFKIREGVFEELVRRKLMVQEAEAQGMQASDEEVRTRIREIPAFQKDGRFDLATYRQVLASNNYTPGSFERLVREDISQQGWQAYFAARVKVSDDEIKRQYMVNEDKRNIKYVLLTTEAGRQAVKVDQAEVDKFLADEAKVNIIKGQFESKKDAEFKGKTFDMVKGQLARDVLASEKGDEVRKANEALGDKVAGMLALDKGSDAKVNALLKPYKVEVKSTGAIANQNSFLPGLGEAPELFKDAFAAKSPIDATQGGKAKKYSTPNWVLVALVTERKEADLSKLESQRKDLVAQISQRKQSEMYEAWLKELRDKADVEANPSVVGADAQAGA